MAGLAWLAQGEVGGLAFLLAKARPPPPILAAGHPKARLARSEGGGGGSWLAGSSFLPSFLHTRAWLLLPGRQAGPTGREANCWAEPGLGKEEESGSKPGGNGSSLAACPSQSLPCLCLRMIQGTCSDSVALRCVQEAGPWVEAYETARPPGGGGALAAAAWLDV